MSERYTIQGGLEHHLFNRFGDDSRYLLPLLLFLVGLVILGAQHFTAHNPVKPETLGIYTVKTAGSSSAGSNSSNGNSSNAPHSSAQPLLSSAGGSSLSGGLSSYSLQGSSLTGTGGMGGGLTSGSGTDTTSGGGSGGSSSGSNNISVTLQTPGATVGPVSVDGTTTTIDPGVPKL